MAVQTDADRKAERDVVVILLVGSLLAGSIVLMFIPSQPRQLQLDSFSLEVVDVLLNEKLDPSRFSCEVYATNDTNYWPSYTLVQNDTADRIVGPPEADCPYMVLFSGKIGNKTYPERWEWIWPEQENEIYTIAKPAITNMTVRNASTNEVVDPAGRWPLLDICRAATQS
jgi:hypothetical protein